MTTVSAWAMSNFFAGHRNVKYNLSFLPNINLANPVLYLWVREQSLIDPGLRQGLYPIRASPLNRNQEVASLS